jgi:hypothetical protein
MSTGQEASDLKYEPNQVSQDDIDTLDMTLEKKRKQRLVCVLLWWEFC